jgi:SAM-dependent methyltransferase
MISTEDQSHAHNWYESDKSFDAVYPLSIRQHTRNHWTPLEVVQLASNYLAAEKKAKVLDIGSGAGKFCLAAAHYKPDAKFFGIELRKNLVDEANKAKKQLALKNVTFTYGNFTNVDLRKYNSIYFYNSFYENIVGINKIDENLAFSSEQFDQYNFHLFTQLEQMPAGTRLATYHSTEKEIPPCFLEVGSQLDNLLKFWIKA